MKASIPMMMRLWAAQELVTSRASSCHDIAGTVFRPCRCASHTLATSKNPEVQCRIHKGSLIIPILSRINPIPRIDTYLFKVHSNIILPSLTVQINSFLPSGLIFTNKIKLWTAWSSLVTSREEA